MPAAAFITTASRRGLLSPASTERSIDAFSSDVPPTNVSTPASAIPKSSGDMSYWVISPLLSSQTRDLPDTVISSMPLRPWTTIARFVPRRLSTCTIFSPKFALATPKTCASTRAGLVRGPSMLKTVRMPSSRRGAAANFIEGWKRGANMKPMPTFSMQSLT
ncbi:hypothetical protein ES708_29507 [subsurface metagenome]